MTPFPNAKPMCFPMSSRGRARQKGVTLIEVLTALALLAGVVASVTGLIGQNARFAAAARDRLLASIAAENLMVLEFADAAAPQLGASEDVIAVGDQTFVYRRTARTVQAGLVQIDLEVRRDGETQTLARLSSVRKGR